MSYFDELDHVKEYIKMCEGFSAETLIEDLKFYLKANKTLLEIGMGPGNDLDLLSKNYKTTGSDYSEHFINLYRRNHPQADLVQLDAVTLNINRTFDGLYSNKVLIHLTTDELKKSVKRQSELLNPKGLIFHTFWRGSGQENSEGLLTQYYLEDELLEIFSEYFKVELIKSYEEFEADDSILLIMSLKV